MKVLSLYSLQLPTSKANLAKISTAKRLTKLYFFVIFFSFWSDFHTKTSFLVITEFGLTTQKKKKKIKHKQNPGSAILQDQNVLQWVISKFQYFFLNPTSRNIILVAMPIRTSQDN